MGLIGVSLKGYPILAIPKKNTIQFSLAKIKANPLSKMEKQIIDYFSKEQNLISKHLITLLSFIGRLVKAVTMPI